MSTRDTMELKEETIRAQYEAALGLVLGAFAILLPTALIGVCANPEMICNLVMKPTLVFAGMLAMGTSLIGLVYLRGDEPDLLAVEA